MERSFDFHGVRVAVKFRSRTVGRDLDHDFHYFKAEDRSSDPAFRIGLESVSLRPRNWRPLLRTKDSMVYLPGWRENRVGFFGRSWVSYSFVNRRCRIYCDDDAIAYEVLYLVILSFVGESLDRKGLHRIHGLALEKRGEGTLLLAPSGGGKSTLAMEFLRRRGLKLFSDDTPLVNRRGELVAFPQRIGLRTPPRVPARFVRRFSRVRYGEKYVVGTAYFANRVATRTRVKRIVLLNQTTQSCTTSAKVARRWLVVPLLKWLVVGYETPQIWQLFLRPSPSDVLAKAQILVDRARTAYSLYRGCPTFACRLSSVPRESARVLFDIL